MEQASLIRDATSNDKAKIKEIIDLSFPRFFRFFASYSVDSEEGKVLVAQTQGSVAGFAKLMEFYVCGIKYACILWIAVHPAFRRRGIALTLTTAGIDALREEGAKAVFASTQRGNAAAKGALGKMGFRRVGFLDLWRVFGWRVFSFYHEIWFAPGEIVLMHD